MKDKIIDINYTKIKSYINSKRPAEELWDQIDIGFSYNKNTYELFVTRPIGVRPDQNARIESPFAKIKYIKTRKIWKLYWMRASGKWELYEPLAESSNLDDVIKCIDEDGYGCFYG